MRFPPPLPKSSLLHAIIALGILIASVALWKAASDLGEGGDTPAGKRTKGLTESNSAEKTYAGAHGHSANAEPAQPPSSERFPWFRLKPLPAGTANARHEWTSEDARDPNVILEIAHNDAEVQRLMEENERVQRRQLIYRKEPVWVQVERAKATGEPVRRLTLPAFDGREVEMEVTTADIAPSGLSGSFGGRIAGRGQSFVTLAYLQGREAFTVVSPEDGTYLQGHPREPGEVMLTSFDPDTYTLPGGAPIVQSR